MRARCHRRFTLVEVIIVLVVLVIAAAMFVAVMRRPEEKTRPILCATNLRQIGLSLLMYSGDHAGYLPNVNPIPTNNFEPLVSKGYLPDGKVWSCPSRTTVMTLGRHAAYRYVGSGLKDDNKSATSVTLAYDQSNNHRGSEWRSVLFIDGHVEGGTHARKPNLLGND